jgi:hypothetical protein
MNFPNGIDGVLSGDRGRAFGELWKVKIFRVSLDPNFRIVEAEFGYKGNFWKMNRWGDVSRVVNGPHGSHKLYRLCVNASLRPKNPRMFLKDVRNFIYA